SFSAGSAHACPLTVLAAVGATNGARSSCGRLLLAEPGGVEPSFTETGTPTSGNVVLPAALATSRLSSGRWLQSFNQPRSGNRSPPLREAGVLGFIVATWSLVKASDRADVGSASCDQSNVGATRPTSRAEVPVATPAWSASASPPLLSTSISSDE